MLFNFFKTLKSFPQGGTHPREEKLTAHKATETLPLPKMVHIPIVQHIGAPAEPIVEKGDMVKAGQIIASSKGFVSANVHSSVSGRVAKIDRYTDSSGYKKIVVALRVKGDKWLEGIDTSEELITKTDQPREEIIEKIAQAGIVGMGGAAFPAHVKLSVPEGKKADYLILNGVECEPFLTSDHRLMLEKTSEILVGAQLLMKALGVKKCVIGIENNKRDAQKAFDFLLSEFPGIRTQALSVKYPQGGEKQLIKAVLNREVPAGGLPIDAGAVVHNVGTAFAVYEAVQKQKPLVERTITVTGHGLQNPGNFRVRVGTPVSELIAAVGGLPEDAGKVINGGPMMGKALKDLDAPVTKATSGIVVLPDPEAHRGEVQPCIRCGKCVEVCPMGLEPYLLAFQGEHKKFEEAKESYVMDCIQCGSCAYECPSHRPLLDYIRLSKEEVRKLN